MSPLLIAGVPKVVLIDTLHFVCLPNAYPDAMLDHEASQTLPIDQHYALLDLLKVFVCVP